MWTIFKVFIEFVTILLQFYVLVFWPWSMWDLSSLTRDWTCTPCIGRRSLNPCTAREVPRLRVILKITPRDFEVLWVIQSFYRSFHLTFSSSRERLSIRLISYYSLTGFRKANKEEFLFKGLQNVPSLKVEWCLISGSETYFRGKHAESWNLLKWLQATIWWEAK